MSKPELLAALEPVVKVLEELGVTYQIGGSVASSIHGMARATMDVDLAAALAPDHVGPFVRDLEREFFVDRECCGFSTGASTSPTSSAGRPSWVLPTC